MLIKIDKDFKYTPGQEYLLEDVSHWYKYDISEDYIYTGGAGTGKTTIIPYIINKLGLEPEEVLFVAFTGKAASVLMQKGFDASTIHSAFYDVREFPKKKDGKIVLKNGRPVIERKFVPKEFIDKRIKLIVLDEWSMVSEELQKVIYKFGVPVLGSGDIHQLPPIFGYSPFYNKVRFELTQITRQAKDNGIIQLATLIRKGKEIPLYKNYNNNAHVLPKKYLDDSFLTRSDMILTVKNKTRNIFNTTIRELHGSTGKLPNVGDKLVCRKNNWSIALNGIPLVNGIVGKVVNPIIKSECNLAQGLYRIDFQPDYINNDYDYYEALTCDYDFLIEPCGSKEIDLYNPGAKLEFAEALTVHLSQGSQYNTVLYWDEQIGDKEYMQKLRYTAVTRAIDKVFMFI
jgi:exodeoxyribonuclease-5